MTEPKTEPTAAPSWQPVPTSPGLCVYDKCGCRHVAVCDQDDCDEWFEKYIYEMQQLGGVQFYGPIPEPPQVGQQ